MNVALSFLRRRCRFDVVERALLPAVLDLDPNRARPKDSAAERRNTVAQDVSPGRVEESGDQVP